MTQSSAPPEVLFYEPGASWWWLVAGPAAGVAMVLIQMSAGYGIQLLVPRHLLRSGDRLPRDSGQGRAHPHVGRADARPSAPGHRTHPHRRHRADLPGAEGPRRAEVAVGARARRAHRRAAGPHRHRPQADQRSRRAGVGAQAPATAGRADPRWWKSAYRRSRRHEGPGSNWCWPSSRRSVAC